MKKLSCFFYTKVKIWLAVILTAAMLTYASVIMKSKSECFTNDLSDDQNLPGLSFGYSVEDINLFFAALSDTGRDCYQELLSVWDSVFPILYGIMYISWLSLLYKKTGRNSKPVLLINLYPLLPMCADWLENITELQLISEYITFGFISESSAKIASFITRIKWLLSSLNYLLILTGLIFLIRNHIKKSKS